MTGDADPHALVQALAADRTGRRNRGDGARQVVEAYQEILRMPV